MEAMEREKLQAARAGSSPALSTFRRTRLASAAKQSGLVYGGIVIATIAEASLAQRWADVPLLCTYAVALCPPAVASHLRAGALIVPVYVLSNLLVSLCDLGIALGWLPFLSAIRAVYQARQELLGELMCSLPGQLDIATMGVLHALRQGARGLIYVRCLGGDPWYSAQRWGLNWAVLMVLQCAYELRTRHLYRKTLQCSDSQDSVQSGVSAASANGSGSAGKGALGTYAQPSPTAAAAPYGDIGGQPGTPASIAAAAAAAAAAGHAVNHARQTSVNQVSAQRWGRSSGERLTIVQDALVRALTRASDGLASLRASNDSATQPSYATLVQDAFMRALPCASDGSATQPSDELVRAFTSVTASAVADTDTPDLTPQLTRLFTSLTAADDTTAAEEDSVVVTGTGRVEGNVSAAYGTTAAMADLATDTVAGDGTMVVGDFTDVGDAGLMGLGADLSTGVRDLVSLSGPTTLVVEARHVGYMGQAGADDSAFIIHSRGAAASDTVAHSRAGSGGMVVRDMGVGGRGDDAVRRPGPDFYHASPRVSVSIKLHDIQPEQLPPRLLSAMRARAHSRMPDMHVSRLAMRRGCVILTLDLTSMQALHGIGSGHTDNNRKQSSIVDKLVSALAEILVEGGGTEYLCHGDALTAQAASELAGYAWDDSAHAFVQSQSMQAQLTALLQLAALCRLISAGPVVQCLAAAAGASSQRAQLQLQLTVPCRSRLVGWQPAGSAVSAEAKALTLTSDVPQLDVLVLVRRQSGAFLPVTLSLLSDNQTPAAGSETWTVTVQAEVDVPCKEASGLSVEMWAKAPADSTAPSIIGPELRVAHSPVLLFTAQQQAAAAELTELVQSMGGVSAIQDLPTHSQDTSAQAATPHLTAYVDDLGLWLSYMTDGSSGYMTETHETQFVNDMAVLGTNLLVYSVRHGLSEISQLLVTTMAKDSSTAEIVVGCQDAPWFLAAAKPAAVAEGAAAVSPLLHAAMASGNADMLEKVLRWGQVYGGRQWRWPWSLTDGSGYTALHLAATQPEASACVALLQTVKRMLPGQIPAAHTAWLHEQGKVRATPSQMFATRHPQHASDSLWEQHSSDSGKPLASSLCQAPTGSTTPAGPSSGSCSDIASMVESASSTADEPSCDAPTDSEPLPTLGALMREAWRWKQPPEYEAWALRQLSYTVHNWARANVTLFVVTAVQMWAAGTATLELPFLLPHALCYMLITATSVRVSRWTWQTLMPLVPWFHILGYLNLSRVPAGRLPTWTQGTTGGGEVLFTLVITAPWEQNVLPYMALVRTVLAISHAWAFDAAGHPHPYALCIAMHTVAVLTNALMRTYQLRSFHRWLRDSARKKDVSATAASSSDQAATKEPEQQQPGKVKVQ